MTKKKILLGGLVLALVLGIWSIFYGPFQKIHNMEDKYGDKK